MRILFVCLGNICRSPTAEGVFIALAEEQGMDVDVDSAGTGGWHVGAPPDERATEAAAARGIALTGAARQVESSDFEEFDLLVAMDAANADDLRRMAPDEATREKVVMFRDYDPSAAGDLDVPDPYYGGPSGFEEVLDMADCSARGLLEAIR